MGALVTPKYVQELAAVLDVRQALEWSVPLTLASAPLPEGWSYVFSDDGSVSFVHDKSPQSPQRTHPLLDRATQALAQLRAAPAAAGSPSATSRSRLLGPFENLDSPAVELFFLDVQTGQHVPEFECPPASVIPNLPDDLRQLLTSPHFGPSPAPADPDQPGRSSEAEEPGTQSATGGLAAAASGATEMGSASERPAPGAHTGVSAAAAAAGSRLTGRASPGSGSRQLSAYDAARNGGGSAAAAGPAAGGPGTAPKPSSRPGSVVGEASRGSLPAFDSSLSPVGTPHSLAASGPRSASPLPVPPAPVPPSGFPASSTELGSEDYEDIHVQYQRDSGTTAGYAGSVSESGGGGGGYRARSGGDGGAGRSNVIAAGSGGNGAGVSATGQALSPSGSVRSAGTGGSGSGSGSGRNSSGRSGSGAATAGGAQRPLLVPPSGRLTFYGWWFEDVESSDLTFRIDSNPTAGGGLAPRHCSLIYDFESTSFTLTMRDPVTPPAPGQPYERVPELVVPELSRNQVSMCDTGRPADLWDLHLGARLRVLGRQVVLKNSDLATAQWHAGYFRQLHALRDKLHQEVQKYKPRVIRPGLVADKGDVRLQSGQQLRHVALQVRELVEDLRQYRPAKAESFLTALPVLL